MEVFWAHNPFYRKTKPLGKQVQTSSFRGISFGVDQDTSRWHRPKCECLFFCYETEAERCTDSLGQAAPASTSSYSEKASFWTFRRDMFAPKSLNIVKARSRWPRLLCRNSSNCSVRVLVVSSMATSYHGKAGPHSYESASYRLS